MSWGREMAFLMMGEMAGGAGEDACGEAIRLGGTPTLRTCCSFLAKKLRGERWVPPELPPWLLRKEVSPKTSPPRPTCIVWRKSPSGGLIMSAVSRLFPCELDTQPTGESLPRLMAGALLASWGPGIGSGCSQLLVHAYLGPGVGGGLGSGFMSQLLSSQCKGVDGGCPSVLLRCCPQMLRP